MGVTVFKRPPTGNQVVAFLGWTIREPGAAPKHVICDKSLQFWCDGFKKWSKNRGIRPRFGAAGRHGSTAVVSPGDNQGCLERTPDLFCTSANP